MANIQVNNIQMPTLRELPGSQDIKVDKGFKFTLLSQIEESDLHDKIKEMIEGITAQGNKLSEHMDIRDLKTYRSMISNFINEVVVNSHKFSRDNFLDKRGRHRVYGIVRVINEKLDALAKELISSEKNQIDLLDRVGEIQGLLLDIVT
ncbi:YaaR family protein [Cellulosilyticum sp. I15G10I2]|uniref:YaaR family protein n=1 Tax=Cellulosilyticum sp. I15G10I2 TaxID=1892843 RepID=UPI00085C616E|nr:YaaR family protein [Cellulosilyticum sp. I15G10I2]